VFFGLAVVVLALDATTKQLAMTHLVAGETRRLVGSFLQLTLLRNPGMAFSQATNLTWLLSLIVIGVSIAVVVVSRRCRSLPWTIALGLILGGALGNLGDRIFRTPSVGRGHVVDWISVFADDGHVWPIFNLADSAIVCGAIRNAPTSRVPCPARSSTTSSRLSSRPFRTGRHRGRIPTSSGASHTLKQRSRTKRKRAARLSSMSPRPSQGRPGWDA
jgi:signal peptidase II